MRGTLEGIEDMEDIVSNVGKYIVAKGCSNTNSKIGLKTK